MTKDSSEQKRLKESDWLVVTALWERGEVTLRELSERFGVSEAALSQGLKRRGSKRGSKAHLANKEIEAKIKEEKEKLVEDIYKFKKKFLNYGDFLMSLTMNEITEARKSGVSIASRKPEIAAIFEATKVYKTIRNDMFHLYDLYNPDNVPDEKYDFNIGVYNEEDIAVLREAQEKLAAEMNSAFEEDAEEINEPDEDE